MKIPLYTWDDISEGGILVVPYVSIDSITEVVDQRKPLLVVAPFDRRDAKYNVRTTSMLRDRLRVPVLCVVPQIKIPDIRALLVACSPEFDGFVFSPWRYSVANYIQFLGDYLKSGKLYHSAGEEFECEIGGWTWSTEGI